MNKKIQKKMEEFKEENIINQNEIINEESDEKESTIIEIKKNNRRDYTWKEKIPILINKINHLTSKQNFSSKNQKFPKWTTTYEQPPYELSSYYNPYLVQDVLDYPTELQIMAFNLKNYVNLR